MTKINKFRAWASDRKAMYYNVGIVPHQVGFSIIPYDTITGDEIGRMCGHSHKITLMQFTGLLDSTKFEDLTIIEQNKWLENNNMDDWNGKEVYEGDVIEFLLAPVELNHASSSDMFGTEPQNSWLECTQATYPVRASAEIFYNESELAYQIRNIKCKVLNIYDEDHDDKYEEDYCIADPNAVAGGADGFNFSLNDFYEDCIDFASDVYMYNGLTFNDFLNVKIIGNIFEDGDLLK